MITSWRMLRSHHLPRFAAPTTVVSPRNCLLIRPPAAADTASQVLSLRYYHATASSLALRRRSRRHSPVAVSSQDNDDDVDEPDKEQEGSSLGYTQLAVTDADVFATSAKSLVDKLYTAILPMKRVNDPFFLTRGFEDDLGPFLLLDLGPVQGQYTIQADHEQSLVTMTTPRSGQFAYILSESTKEWVSIADGHVLEGMLVRELIRHAQGLPRL